MKEYLPVLKKTKLFAGVGEDEIGAMLTCLGAVFRTYKKGEYVFRQGDFLREIMVLAEGKLHIQNNDYWGNCSIIHVVEVGEMFGEAYIAPDSGTILNDVAAVEPAVVIFFDVNRILHVCPSACKFHAKVVQNLFYAISGRNRKLVSKLRIASRRTTRDKLMEYLSEEAKRQGKSSFRIQFNRQQLADFLSVDRSAMSSELGKMRDEGLIEFERNRFTLL